MYKNTFTDHRQKIQDSAGKNASGYTAKELEDIKIALNKKLGPEFISKRKGPGYNSIQYLEGWKAINLANEIFGPNGWCTELKEFKVDYIDDKHGSISLGLSCIVRVILKDGTFHEDVGYGSIENCKSKSMAFDKCKKEACTDGMKRALRQFGNALGNCLYDKEFLQQITKVSREPDEFDAKSLMRRSTTIAKMTSNFEGAQQVKPESDGARHNTTQEKYNRADKMKKKPASTNNNGAGAGAAANGNAINGSAAVTGSTVANDKIARSLLAQNAEEVDGADNRDTDRKENARSKDELEDSFLFSDDWPEEEEDMNNEILNSNNFIKGNLPDSEFEDDEENDGIQEESTANNITSGALVQEKVDGSSSANTSIPDQVTFVSATSADTIQQDPTLQSSLKYDISFSSSKMNRSVFINHSKSLPVKKSQVKVVNRDATGEGKPRKPNMLNKPMINPISKPSSAAKPIPAMLGDINKGIVGTVSNPMIKRSFGLPPNKLSNKRFKK